jgi:transposase InsO family protein
LVVVLRPWQVLVESLAGWIGRKQNAVSEYLREENRVLRQQLGRKRTTWSRFLEPHWEVLAAADFFTVEIWGPRGLVTFYVLFVIELATRRIEIASVTPGPNEAWM